MSAALHQIVVIFIGIAAGFACRRLGVLSEQGTGTLSNLVVKLILPLYLFAAILNTSVDVAAGGVLAHCCSRRFFSCSAASSPGCSSF